MPIRHIYVFPESKSELIRDAAAGNFTAFLADYLKPCWDEVLVLCRQRGIQISDADDVFQELLLRIIRSGHLRMSVNSAAGPLISAKANLPGRYLLAKRYGLSNARFCTYLKQTIANVLFEQQRKRGRRREQVGQDAVLEQMADQSVSVCLDVEWITRQLTEAAEILANRCQKARGKARRREFDVMYLLVVRQMRAQQIAQQWHLDRTTVVGILGLARKRYLAILREISGVEDMSELRRLVQRHPLALVAAFQAAGSRRNIA